MKGTTAILLAGLLVASPVLGAGYDLVVLRELPLGRSATVGGMQLASVVDYSNLGTFLGAAALHGAAALEGANTITRLVADDITPTGASAGLDVIQFKFTIANLNLGRVTVRPRVRFWLADGAGGAPGTYYAQPAAVDFTFDPLAVNGNTAVVLAANLSPGQLAMPGTRFWAGLTFDNADGTTGATAAHLDNFGQAIFDPPTVGSSADEYYSTVYHGSFFGVADPFGVVTDFGGAIPANLGWEFTADITIGVESVTWTGVKELFRR